ncbi:unnamed protein product [Dovyalis caffra]|uniref:Uncharacterized protein n=1 Tax=Dovyalis caffra TaxID=77055 RepID=A0AAV1QNA4_9ROSI|nr:unnamed protein product [Dovyalis caffra]
MGHGISLLRQDMMDEWVEEEWPRTTKKSQSKVGAGISKSADYLVNIFALKARRILARKGILLERLLAYCCLTTSLTLAAQAYLLITDPLPYLLAFPNERTKNLGADWASRTKESRVLRMVFLRRMKGYFNRMRRYITDLRERLVLRVNE